MGQSKYAAGSGPAAELIYQLRTAEEEGCLRKN
jgi:hypothetical protein